MERTFLDLDLLVAERRSELVRAARRPRPGGRSARQPLRRHLAALFFALAARLDARYVVTQYAALENRGRLETA